MVYNCTAVNNKKVMEVRLLIYLNRSQLYTSSSQPSSLPYSHTRVLQLLLAQIIRPPVRVLHPLVRLLAPAHHLHDLLPLLVSLNKRILTMLHSSAMQIYSLNLSYLTLIPYILFLRAYSSSHAVLRIPISLFFSEYL